MIDIVDVVANECYRQSYCRLLDDLYELVSIAIPAAESEIFVLDKEEEILV